MRQASRQPPPASSICRPIRPISTQSKNTVAKLKVLLRKAAVRTISARCESLVRFLETFTPDQCANYCRHAGCVIERSKGNLAKSNRL
jgi:hypothetical protein